MKLVYMIVNYNDFTNTKKLLDQINDYKSIDLILVVDNHSKDDSVEIENGINKFVELLKNHKLELRVYTKHTLHAKVYIMLKNQLYA